MTISSTTNRAAFTGNGVTLAFSFPYPVLLAADLKVYQAGVLKTLTTHYTLSGSAPYTAGTNVTFLVAPAAAESVVVIRDPSPVQATDLVEGDPLPVEASVEKPLDRLTLLVQRLKDRLDRAAVLNDTDITGASLVMPTPVASKLIGFDSAGTALQLYAAAAIVASIIPSAYIQTLLDDADAATARTTLGAVSSADVLALAATQAQQETGSSTSVLVTPGRQQFHPSAAKAWALVQTDGTTAAAYGVASITDNGLGDLSLTWTTAFSTANYAVVATARFDFASTAGTFRIAQQHNGSQTAALARVTVGEPAGFTKQDPNFTSVAAYGDQ